LDPYATIEQAVIVCPGADTVLGIDVSRWQGDIDWDRVAATNVRFAYIRVAAGVTEDVNFDTNWSEAERVGLIRGAYQALHPGSSISQQTDLWLNKVGGVQNGELPPIVDYEVQGPNALDKLRTWLNTIEGATGVTPIIYSNPSFWSSEGSSSNEFGHYPLWIANYEVNCPDVPAPWTGWMFWQYTEAGSVDGIGTNVDRDWFDGSMADLRALVDRSECNNGVIEGEEQCDGADLGGVSCSDIGFNGGQLACDGDCNFDSQACTLCGDGNCSGDEDEQTCPQDCSVCQCGPEDAPQSRSCGWCGEQTRECDGCHWGLWLDCRDEGECERGSLEQRACEGGLEQRLCGEDCSWGDWGTCQPERPDDTPSAGGCSQGDSPCRDPLGILLPVLLFAWIGRRLGVGSRRQG